MTTAVMGGGSRRERAKAKRKYVLIAVAAVVVLALLWLMITLFNGGGLKKTVPPEVVQQITILKPPPPPPPPPPPKDEPVKVKEDPQPVPEPQAAPPKSEAPPSPQLAADSDGPGDLGGKAGGEDYKGDGVVASTGGGGTGGGGGTYRAFVVSEFRRVLLTSERLRAMRFKRVPVRVTVAASGQIEKVEIVESTGKPEVDRLLVNLLQSVGKVSNPPPDGQAKTYSWLISPEV